MEGTIDVLQGNRLSKVRFQVHDISPPLLMLPDREHRTDSTNSDNT